jgi:hypothetical protein
MSTLKGSRELAARLRAIKQTFKPAGRAWAEDTVALVRPDIPVRTGKGQRSVRVKNASQKKASVAAIYYIGILDKGTKAYEIRPRKASRLVFKVGEQTIFARKVDRPALSGLHFAARAGREALRRNPMAAAMIKLWNSAA